MFVLTSNFRSLSTVWITFHMVFSRSHALFVSPLFFLSQVCLQPFMSTQNRDQLQSHIESKHSNKTFEECFPEFQQS